MAVLFMARLLQGQQVDRVDQAGHIDIPAKSRQCGDLKACYAFLVVGRAGAPLLDGTFFLMARTRR